MNDVSINDLKKLKPCPYCGNTSPALYHFSDGFIVHCDRYMCNCGVAFRSLTIEECIKMWNEHAESIKGG